MKNREDMARNYRRFYALLKQLKGADKETLVLQYTGGRTKHLGETTDKEYDSMCDDMERVAGYEARREAWKQELRKKRSRCLHYMQKLGVDTTDWDRVDAFCGSPRIVGKPFRKLDLEELEMVATKLRIIAKKGGLRGSKSATFGPAQVATTHYMMIDFSTLKN